MALFARRHELTDFLDAGESDLALLRDRTEIERREIASVVCVFIAAPELAGWARFPMPHAAWVHRATRG
jgi:hypothetical protein